MESGGAGTHGNSSRDAHGGPEGLFEGLDLGAHPDPSGFEGLNDLLDFLISKAGSSAPFHLSSPQSPWCHITSPVHSRRRTQNS